MPRYVTVTPASVRSVAATLTARTVAVSRRYLFSSAARANIVAARTIAAALSRGRTALVPVRAARTVVADVVARRALAVAVMGDRLVSAGLGAVRSLAGVFSAGRLAVAGMVRWRPGAGTVSASRTVSAVQYRGGVLSISVTGRRDAAVAPYRESGPVLDSAGANVVDADGANILGSAPLDPPQYLRWRVMYPVVLGVRAITAAPVSKRLLAAGAAGVRTIAALPQAIRQLAAVFTADPTVPRFTSLLLRKRQKEAAVEAKRTVEFAPYTSTRIVVDEVYDSDGAHVVDSAGANLDSEEHIITKSYLRWRVASMTTAGSRTVTAAPARGRLLTSTVSGQRQISGSLFNLTSASDSNGDTITDDSSATINVLI